MNLLTVGGVALPRPTKYNVTYSDLDSSDTARNERGVLVRNRVRAGAVKIEAGWTVAPAAANTILSAITAASLPVTYYDPATNQTRSITMYVSDRSCQMAMFVNDSNTSHVLWDISLSFVEY